MRIIVVMMVVMLIVFGPGFREKAVNSVRVIVVSLISF